MATSTDIKEWLKVCKDGPLHEKCKKIKCYERVGDNPKELLIMFSTYDEEALNLLSRDFGDDWDLESYPLHEIPDFMEEDHWVVAG
jgi:hypothetical protein